MPLGVGFFVAACVRRYRLEIVGCHRIECTPLSAYNSTVFRTSSLKVHFSDYDSEKSQSAQAALANGPCLPLLSIGRQDLSLRSSGSTPYTLQGLVARLRPLTWHHSPLPQGRRSTQIVPTNSLESFPTAP